MRLSVFTPTHNPKHLPRLAMSLARQRFQNFEWVIVPNGGVNVEELQRAFQARVVPYYGKTANIGELKRFACEACSGDVLVEVDHDDELTPDCLEAVADSFADETTDFVYSNCANLDPNDRPVRYAESHGWEYRPFQWNGDTVDECVSFAPEPASLSRVWYAPNHVRAWRRAFYHRIGGHDTSLDVLDDHDLVCRSYLFGNIVHIDRCLYVYHYHKENTSTGAKNARIQQRTLDMHDRYIYPLAERWSDLNGLRKIDLCGGIDKQDGYESVDLAGGDITADLNETWPFEDGTVGVFRAHDALEHLCDPIHTMREAYRCLAPKGWLLTSTPSTDGRGAFQDPTHRSFWNSNSFWYYTRKQQASYIGTPAKFQMTRVKNWFPSDWHKAHNIAYVKADLHKFAGRTPGEVEI